MGGSVPLSAPDPAANSRWKDSHGTSLTTLADSDTPLQGRNRAARIRGHRGVWQPDIPDWRWHWGGCQNSVGEGMSSGK